MKQLKEQWMTLGPLVVPAVAVSMEAQLLSPAPVCPRADVTGRRWGEAPAASQPGSRTAKPGLSAAEELVVSSNAASVVRIKMRSSHSRYLHTALRGKIAQMDLALWREPCYSMGGCNLSFQTCSHSPAGGGGKWRWHPSDDGTEPNSATVLCFCPCKSRKRES